MKHVIHAVMLAFAGASLGNVRAFLVDAGHPSEVAWLLGLALGAALVTVSIMLTRIDRDSDRQAFNWLCGAGLVLGVVSGSLQAAEYAKHLHLAWGILLGFAVPLGGEVGLAIAAGAYTKARQRERFRNVAVTIEAAVADRLESAIADLDPTMIRKHVERTINALSRLAVDSVSAQATQFYVRGEQQLDTEGNTEGDTKPLDECVNTPIVNTSDRLQQARRQKQEQRREQLLHTIREHGPHTQITTLADLLGVGRKTVYSDLGALEDAGVIHRNGNGIEVLG